MGTPSRVGSSPGSFSSSRPGTPGEIRKAGARPGSSGYAGGASMQNLPSSPVAASAGSLRSPAKGRMLSSPVAFPAREEVSEEEDALGEDSVEELALTEVPLTTSVEEASVEDPLAVTIKRLEFGEAGDLSDDEAPGPLDSKAYSCQRGSMGVRSLAMTDTMKSQRLAQSAQLAETLSSSSAVNGRERKWVRGENIGRGSLGNVFQALDQVSGQMFAVKEVLINTSDASDQTFKQALDNELRICCALKHPSIVSYLGSDCIDHRLYIYLEYMIGGSMASVLQQFGAFEECLIATYTSDLLEGLAYLHTQDPPVLHRDIKSPNILMGADLNGFELCAKLADFGCSKRNQETLSRTLKGSIPWMAPEILQNVGYGRKADVWSFGCVLIEMGSAKTPWGKLDNPMAAMYKIGMSNETPAIPDQLSELYRSFTDRCLQRDPATRASTAELLQHEFAKRK